MTYNPRRFSARVRNAGERCGGMQVLGAGPYARVRVGHDGAAAKANEGGACAFAASAIRARRIAVPVEVGLAAAGRVAAPRRRSVAREAGEPRGAAMASAAIEVRRTGCTERAGVRRDVGSVAGGYDVAAGRRVGSRCTVASRVSEAGGIALACGASREDDEGESRSERSK